MTNRRPPVIPEIAKAYQSDPGTTLALASMKAGTSGAPVATQGYGVGDGMARITQAIAGALMDKEMQKRYDGDEQQLLALRKARGVDGLTGIGAVPASSPQVQPTPPAPANAPAIAAALGAPAPQDASSAAPGPPGMPGPATPPMAAPGPAPAPAMGGGPMGRIPFSAGSSAGAEPVPAAPPPVAKPVAPQPVGATRSRMLDAAYRVMADANPYESAQGQDMYTSGLDNQTKLDESAAERKQRLDDMTYSSDLGQYANGAEQDRGQQFAERNAAIAANRATGVRKEEETFKAGESKLERAKDIQVANIKAGAELQAAKVRSSGGGMGLTDEESAALSKAAMDKRLDISKLTRFQAKNVAMALVDADHAGTPLDAVALHAYANLSANPSAQNKAMLIEAAPTVINSMRDAGKKVNFSPVQFVGKLQAFTKGELNDPDFRDYMSKRADVVQTLAQIMRGTGATDKAVALETDAAPKTMDPKAFDAWANAQFDQVLPRVDIAEKRGLMTHDAAEAVRKARLVARGGGDTPAPAASSGWGKMVVH